MTKKFVLLTTAVVVVVGVSAGIAAPLGGEDERSLTGATLERASAAALEQTGGGTVVESEVGDGDAAYEVEIRLQNGRQVEVSLDSSFTVISQERDDDGNNGADDEGGTNDD